MDGRGLEARGPFALPQTYELSAPRELGPPTSSLDKVSTPLLTPSSPSTSHPHHHRPSPLPPLPTLPPYYPIPRPFTLVHPLPRTQDWGGGRVTEEGRGKSQGPAEGGETVTVVVPTVRRLG